MVDFPRNCPHCGSRLRRWRVPPDSSWEEEFFFVCFNDDCPYYKEGWGWMKEKYNQHASYRCAVNPTTGVPLPLPVWSPSANRDLIVDDAQGEDE